MSRLKRAEAGILDECLNQLQAGGMSVQACLDSNPDHAEALAPLLALGDELQHVAAPAPPRKAFISSAKLRLLREARLSLEPSEARKRGGARAGRWPRLSARWAYILVSLLMAFVLVGSSYGVAQAADSSLPGDSLYGLKRGIEKARLVISLTAAGDLELLSDFADERIDELQALLDAGRADDLELGLGEYESILELLLELLDEVGADGDPGSLEHIQSRLAHNQEVLQQILERFLEKFPEDARQIQAIEHAIDRSGHSLEVLETIRSGGSPSDLAPGQQDREVPKGGIGPKKTPGPPSGTEEGTGKDHKPPGGKPTPEEEPPTKTPRPKPHKTPKPTSGENE